MATQINYPTSTLNVASTTVSVTANIANINVSGTANFANSITPPTCAASPILGNDLANKGYVDSMVGQYSGGFNMFFNYSVTDGAYKELGNTIVNVGVDQIDTTTTSNARVPVEAFISSALGITTIPVGIWNVLVYGKISAATDNVRYSCDILTVDPSGNELIRATSNNSSDINALVDPSAYTMNVTLATPITIALTTRLAVRIFVQNLSSAGAYTVSTYFQNTYYSFIQTSLNEGTTLLSSTNNWTGSNTFTPITPSSSITYSPTNGTVEGAIGYTYSASYTGGTGGAGAADWPLGAIPLPKGVYFLSACVSYRIQTTPTNGIGYITSYIGDGTNKYGYSRIPSPAPLVNNDYATNINAVICLNTDTTVTAYCNLNWSTGLMNKIGNQFKFTATRIA